MDSFDLFEYPSSPGHCGVDTSIAGAEKIAPAAPAIRDKVLKAVADAGPHGLTVIEFCDRHGVDRFGAQPRFSELRAMRRIADGGQRRRNPSGVRVIAWVLPQYVPDPPGGEA